MSVERERFGSGFVPPWVVREHHERYLHAARYVRNLSVLDCACGTGQGTRTFLDSGPRHLIAVDLSEEALRQASVQAPAATLLRGSATAIPLASSSVDVVISLETIEHLTDDSAYLDEIARVLRPRGAFVCSTPNRLVTNPAAVLTDRPFNRFHVREYSEGEFRALLSARFENIEILGQNPCSRSRVAVMTVLGRLMGPPVAARINQALKLPRLIWDRPSRYAVQPRDARAHYEYLVAVCSNRARAT